MLDITITEEPNLFPFVKCCQALKNAWNNDMIGYSISIPIYEGNISMTWKGFSRPKPISSNKCVFCHKKLKLKKT